MITSLRLVNFKNFADEFLRVGPFTVIAGTNASGKSNIRDAFRFLHGIGRGYTLAEIVGGKYGGGGQKVWNPIRGAPTEIGRMDMHSSYKPVHFTVDCSFKSKGKKANYSISIEFNPSQPGIFSVLSEALRVDGGTVYETHEKRSPGLTLLFGEEGEAAEYAEVVGFSRAQPALTQFQQYGLLPWPEEITDVGLHSVLDNMRFFDWSPNLLREPSPPGFVTLGASGENLPSVLNTICSNPESRQVLMSWLQELTPMDVRDLAFPLDPSGHVHLQLIEGNGNKISAYSASDGTLRFLAVLAALLGENSSGVFFFEEIDNGIHPTRLWLLLKLIETQTAKGKVQVVTTTHSPDLLNFVNDSTFQHTSLVYRSKNSADALIRAIAEIPEAQTLRTTQGLGKLHASGWMEDVQAFSEEEPNDGNWGT